METSKYGGTGVFDSASVSMCVGTGLHPAFIPVGCAFSRRDSVPITTIHVVLTSTLHYQIQRMDCARSGAAPRRRVPEVPTAPRFESDPSHQGPLLTGLRRPPWPDLPDSPSGSGLTQAKRYGASLFHVGLGVEEVETALDSFNDAIRQQFHFPQQRFQQLQQLQQSQ